VTNPLSTCNCLNGICSASSQCICKCRLDHRIELVPNAQPVLPGSSSVGIGTAPYASWVANSVRMGVASVSPATVASGCNYVSSCPSDTIATGGLCTPYHPDCATYSGTSFSKPSSCPPNRPVLSNGRCLPTCSKTGFFDLTSGCVIAAVRVALVRDQVTASHAQALHPSSAEDLV
jgi:hypothetical protein